MKTYSLKDFFSEVGDISHFVITFFREAFRPRLEFSELVQQCFYVGNKTLPLVGLTGLIMGLVITIQSHPSLETFGAESWLPSVVSVSLLREIIPVITAVICAGKIGSSISAELGSMKVTEQIDAMEVSGTNPFKYLVVIISDAIALFGAYIGMNMKQVISLELYSNQIFDKLTFSDIIPSIIKSFFFGFAIGIIGCFKGFNTKNGTQGVGQAANSAVVASTFVVFIIDLVAAQIADIFQLT